MATSKLSEVTSFTDPKCVFDPKFEKTLVIKYYKPTVETSESNDKENEALSPNEDPLKYDGILIPIIKINSAVIPATDLISMNLNYTKFVPTLTIKARINSYTKLEIPGMVNTVTVVMIPPEDGIYRKISVDFYIKNVTYIGPNVIYECEYYYPELYKKYTRSFTNENGNKLTTYELLETIAKENKLGFAVTEKCKDIADTKVRLCRNQNIQEIINEHISFGGLDENSIFTSWIDLYGYLQMSNIAWVLNQQVTYEDISMYEIVGISNPSGNFTGNGLQYGDKTFRVFSNLRADSKKMANKISSYTYLIDNNSVKNFGTNNKYYCVDPVCGGGTNSITTEQMIITEDSIDGKDNNSMYNFERNSYIGVEMGFANDGNTPVLYQKRRRNTLLTRLKAKRLKVELQDMHIGLERGTLVGINIFEYDRETKMTMLRNISNLQDEGDLDAESKMSLDNMEEIATESNFGVINNAVSGIYYIDGMEFNYNSDQKKITQVLYLIKKDTARNYYNLLSLPK